MLHLRALLILDGNRRGLEIRDETDHNVPSSHLDYTNLIRKIVTHKKYRCHNNYFTQPEGPMPKGSKSRRAESLISLSRSTFKDRPL